MIGSVTSEICGEITVEELVDIKDETARIRRMVMHHIVVVGVVVVIAIVATRQ